MTGADDANSLGTYGEDAYLTSFDKIPKCLETEFDVAYFTLQNKYRKAGCTVRLPLQLDIRHKDGRISRKTAYINGSAICGRGETCDIILADSTVSRQHFAIEYSNGEFYIQDLETTNGTYLNHTRLTHRRRMIKDDTVRAGDLEIHIRW